MRGSWNRPEKLKVMIVQPEWVSQVCTVFCHMVPLEVNPLMPGDPSEKEKLMIDAAVRLLFTRNGEDSKALY
jgi:hypothetical protein